MAPLDIEMKNIACQTGSQTPYSWSDSAADIFFKGVLYCRGI